MDRPSLARLQASAYPSSVTLEPRFGDMDALRHLNNVAIARLYEEGRVRFTDGSGVRPALESGHGFLVAQVCIHYLAEGRYPDTLTVGCGIGRVGSASFRVSQGLFQGGRCIGVADTTLVHVRRGAGAQPLPDPLRTALFAQLIRSGPDVTEAGAAPGTALDLRDLSHA